MLVDWRDVWCQVANASKQQERQSYLINKVLIVVVCQRLRRSNNLVQVCVHEVVYNVDIVELFSFFDSGPQNVLDANDVFVPVCFVLLLVHMLFGLQST